jgi:hypothetical protein
MAPEIKSAPDLSERDFKEVERDFAALCIKLMGASL